jgi:hypothetical protein
VSGLRLRSVRELGPLTWVARLDEDVKAADDLAELRWFARDEIPWDELAFTHYAPALLFAFERQQHS